MYFKIKSEAQEALKKAVDQFDCDFEDEIKLEFPPNPELGDLASTVSFQLAKHLRKAPNLIAPEVVEKIELPEIFEKVEATGPYVNFFINHDIFAKQLLDSVDEDYGELPKVDEKIILEHTSANPNGPLHIGHIRNSVLGDSLRRLLTTAGREVDTQYYVNDMGRQLAMIVFGMEELGLKLEDQPAEKIDHKVGELYFKVNQMLKEDESLGEGVDATIRKYEGGPSDLDEKFEYAVNSCLEGVKETLKRMNVKHEETLHITFTNARNAIRYWTSSVLTINWLQDKWNSLLKYSKRLNLTVTRWKLSSMNSLHYLKVPCLQEEECSYL